MEITFFDLIILAMNIFRNFYHCHFPSCTNQFGVLSLSRAIYYFTLVILSICAHTHDVISFNRKTREKNFLQPSSQSSGELTVIEKNFLRVLPPLQFQLQIKFNQILSCGQFINTTRVTHSNDNISDNGHKNYISKNLMLFLFRVDG